MKENRSESFVSEYTKLIGANAVVTTPLLIAAAFIAIRAIKADSVSLYVAVVIISLAASAVVAFCSSLSVFEKSIKSKSQKWYFLLPCFLVVVVSMQALISVGVATGLTKLPL